MMNAASSNPSCIVEVGDASASDPSFIVDVGEAYPYPSHVIAPNFVTQKLSGKDTYNVWDTQIRCLLKSHQMYGFVGGKFPSPAGNGKGKEGDIDAWIISDSLVKGWILGSLSDGVAKKVVSRLKHKHKNTDFTAKDLWDELQRNYGPSVREQAAETKMTTRQAESVTEVNPVKIKLTMFDKFFEEETEKEENKKCRLAGTPQPCVPTRYPPPLPGKGVIQKEENKGWLYNSIYNYFITGVGYRVIDHLEGRINPWDKIPNNGTTLLHLAVGSSFKNNHEILKKLLVKTPPEELLDLINPDGSTVLHVAAIGGNTKAVDMLVKRNPELLLAKDKEGHIPLALSISNMHKDTSKRLYWHMEVYRHLLEEKEKEYGVMTCKTFKQHEQEKKYGAEKEKKYGALNTGKSGEDCCSLSLACKTLEQQEKECDALLSGEDIMTCKTLEQQKEYDALCQLEKQEKEYDALFTGKSCEDLVVLAISCEDIHLAKKIIDDYPDALLDDSDAVLTALAQNFPPELNFWERDWEEECVRMAAPYRPTVERLRDSSRGGQPLKIFIYLFAAFSLVATMFYRFLKLLVRPFFKDTIQIHEDAIDLLSDVCNTIRTKDDSNTYHQYYTTSPFEATRRNASTFIRYIMTHFPDAIGGTNEDGHNFIQYSVIKRSEKIYNLLYEFNEHGNIYKTIKDSFGNNLLHLAARLAPTNKLNLISGEALQVQRELQWFKEVERFVCPLCLIQKNSDDETPQMVFTREHKDLVIKGENWIKKTASSYTIVTTLIITIVFAAAITVPGGNNQESGIPIFANNIAFKVFAISDAISLFTGVMSLLMSLSILTARCAEEDFLVRLPRKLIIGLTMLFLSTTAMVIAFGATLFLVFGQSHLWTLIPIGALTCLPIMSFMTLQCPLIVELISATYGGGIFVRERYLYFY